MRNMLAEQWALGDEWIKARYEGGDAAALLARAEAWLADREAEEWRIRGAFVGRMLAGQLDLLCVAAERVRVIKINCEGLAAQRREVAAMRRQR